MYTTPTYPVIEDRIPLHRYMKQHFSLTIDGLHVAPHLLGPSMPYFHRMNASRSGYRDSAVIAGLPAPTTRPSFSSALLLLLFPPFRIACVGTQCSKDFELSFAYHHH